MAIATSSSTTVKARRRLQQTSIGTVHWLLEKSRLGTALEIGVALAVIAFLYYHIFE